MLDVDTKAQLLVGLEAQWRVHRCVGEADICIAHNPGPIVVAASDSDFTPSNRFSVKTPDKWPNDIRPHILDNLEISSNAWIVQGADSKLTSASWRMSVKI